MKDAQFQNSLGTDDGKIQCELCPHRCVIAEEHTGICRVRGVRGGRLKALAYGYISSIAVDPIEKKPLYHFRPGSRIFSVGGWGCNLSCKFCQNWQISQQFFTDTREVSPAELIKMAVESDTGAIAYTYNEPLINYEYIFDCAVLAREHGLANVLVTNGFIMPEPAAGLLPYVDALNIDIKGMDEKFYIKNCGGTLAPVLDFAVQCKNAGCHVEITNLVIPGENDSDEMIKLLAEWIAENLGRDTVLHLSAYFPRYKFTVQPTSYELLANAKKIAVAYLDNIYLGNV